MRGLAVASHDVISSASLCYAVIHFQVVCRLEWGMQLQVLAPSVGIPVQLDLQAKMARNWSMKTYSKGTPGVK